MLPVALSSFVWKSSSKLFWGSLFGEGGSFNLTYPSNFSYSLGGVPYICVLSIPTSSGEDLYYLLPMLFQLLFFLTGFLAWEKYRTLGPARGPHSQNIQHCVQCSVCRAEKLNPSQSLSLRAAGQHLYPVVT